MSIIGWEKFLLFCIQKMKNKNLLFKFGLLVFAVSCFGLSYTFATNFHLNVDNMMAYNASELEKNLIPIHFADNWNDFWGFFYFSNGLWDYTGQTLSDYQYEVYIWSGRKNVNREYYVCARQIKWFYYIIYVSM